MNQAELQYDPLREYAQQYCSGTLSAEQTAVLEQRLRDDPRAMDFFVLYMEIHSQIAWEARARGEQRGLGTSVPSAVGGSEDSGFSVQDSDSAAHPSSLIPDPSSLIIHTFPTIHYPLSTIHPFVGGILFSYLMATVIFGIGLVVGALMHVSDPVQVARQSAPRPSPVSPLSSTVGRITGMVDCRWEGAEVRGQGSGAESPQSPLPNPQSLVSLGDKFALASGLMEITYDTGAKVILQGPVTYEVESAAGGYLSVGKLTAKLENKAKDSNPQSPIPNPSSLSTIHYPLFTIKTPTAIVTDLGTEFGIEVSKEGLTTSHVFRGVVEVQVVGDAGKPEGAGRVLRENESVRVDGRQGERKIVVVSDAKSARFAREIPKRTIKTLDLVDVVAGGDGFSGRRGRGIDPTNGLPTDSTLAEPKNTDANDYGRFRMTSDGKYHRVRTFPFIDGVFIPDGHPGGVQVDSAGHRFSEFAVRCNTTAGNIWAGGVIPVLSSSMPPSIAALLPSLPPSRTLGPTKLGAIDYASKSHALIFLPANNGITFDLDAIRRASPSFKPVRFLATAGNTEIASEDALAEAYADLWVLVNGQVRYRRREINKCSGVFPIALSIAKEDRFLTLVATDGGHDIGFGWILFGDPVLEMATSKQKGE